MTVNILVSKDREGQGYTFLIYIRSHSSKLNGKTSNIGASLVPQWLRVCLPMQGTRVRALVWEDPTCRGATKPVSHNY